MAVHFIKRGAVLFYEGVQEEEEEGSLFTIVRAREVRFLTRWDQHAVAQRRLYKVSRGADLFFFGVTATVVRGPFFVLAGALDRVRRAQRRARCIPACHSPRHAVPICLSPSF